MWTYSKALEHVSKEIANDKGSMNVLCYVVGRSQLEMHGDFIPSEMAHAMERLADSKQVYDSIHAHIWDRVEDGRRHATYEDYSEGCDGETYDSIQEYLSEHVAEGHGEMGCLFFLLDEQTIQAAFEEDGGRLEDYELCDLLTGLVDHDNVHHDIYEAVDRVIEEFRN